MNTCALVNFYGCINLWYCIDQACKSIKELKKLRTSLLAVIWWIIFKKSTNPKELLRAWVLFVCNFNKFVKGICSFHTWPRSFLFFLFSVLFLKVKMVITLHCAHTTLFWFLWWSKSESVQRNHCRRQNGLVVLGLDSPWGFSTLFPVNWRVYNFCSLVYIFCLFLLVMALVSALSLRHTLINCSEKLYGRKVLLMVRLLFCLFSCSFLTDNFYLFYFIFLSRTAKVLVKCGACWKL